MIDLSQVTDPESFISKMKEVLGPDFDALGERSRTTDWDRAIAYCIWRGLTHPNTAAVVYLTRRDAVIRFWTELNSAILTLPADLANCVSNSAMRQITFDTGARINLINSLMAGKGRAISDLLIWTDIDKDDLTVIEDWFAPMLYSNRDNDNNHLVYFE